MNSIGEGVATGHGSPTNTSEIKIEIPTREAAGREDLVLEIHGVKTNILDFINFDIHKSELIAVLGPTGSGKTTLLKQCVGLLPNPKRGVINRHFKSFKFVAPQSEFVHPEVTLREALEQQVELTARKYPEKRQLVDDVLAESGLIAFQYHRLGSKEVTPGFRRRLHIALQTFNADTDLIFIDEPTSGIDAASAFSLVEMIRNVAKRNNTAVVCSLHGPSEKILELVDQVLVLAGGHQLFFGSAVDAQAFFSRVPLENHDYPFLKKLHNPSSTELLFLHAQLYQDKKQTKVTFGGKMCESLIPQDLYESVCRVEENLELPVNRVCKYASLPASGHKEVHPLLISKASLFVQWWVLFKRHLTIRLRERGFYRTTVLLFLLFSLLLGATYYNMEKNMSNISTLPLEVELPALELSFPLNPPGYPVSDSSAKGEPQKAKRSLAFSSSTELDRWTYVTRIVLSFLLNGFTADPSEPHVLKELVYNGVDGLGTHLNFTDNAGPMLMLLDCVYDKIVWDRTKYLVPTMEIPNWDNSNDTRAQKQTEIVVKLYQLLDLTFNLDWNKIISCWDSGIALMKYKCVLGETKVIFDAAGKCMKTGILPGGKKAKGPTAKPADQAFDAESVESLNVETTGTGRLAIKVKNQKVIDGWWSVFNLMVPILGPIDRFMGRLAFGDVDSDRLRQFDELWSSWMTILDKLSNECVLPWCSKISKAIHILMNLGVDWTVHFYTLMNITGYLFIVVALAGSIGIESAMSFVRTRDRANHEMFNKTYNRVAFGVSKMMVDAVVQAIPLTMVALIVGSMSRLYDLKTLIKFWAVVLGVGFSGGGLATMGSASCSTPGTAVALSLLLIVLTMLMCGFVLRIAVPRTWHPAVGLFSAYRQGYSGLVALTFPGKFGILPNWFVIDFICGAPYPIQHWSVYLCILLTQGLFFRFVAIILVCTLHKHKGLKNA